MGKRHKIKDLSQILPEEIQGFEKLFDPQGDLLAVKSLNTAQGDVVLTDTDGNALTMNPDTKKMVVTNAMQIYQVYDGAGGGTIDGTERTVNLDTEDISHEDFSLATDEITVDYAGTYRIGYYVTWQQHDTTGSTIALVECHMEYYLAAWTNHPRSYSVGYAYEFTAGSECGGTGCQFLWESSSDSQKLRLRVQRVQNTTTLRLAADRTMVNIVRVG